MLDPAELEAVLDPAEAVLDPAELEAAKDPVVSGRSPTAPWPQV